GNAIGALGADVSNNNVPTTVQDQATWQHMVTFSLALADGLMTWTPDWQTTGDFKNITDSSSTGKCYWNGSGVCDWPVPVPDTPTALDDLWHAAVNGHGAYFHAGDPQSMTNGLSAALGNMSARTAAAAASATSSPNITQQDNVVYSSTFTTAMWNGEVVAQYVDPSTGNVLPTILGSAQGTLDGATAPASDCRTIYTFDGHQPNNLRWATYSGRTATEKAWVDNACSPASKLSQCAFLSVPQLATANSGDNLVNFIRGQNQYEATIYRDRQHALGDTVNAAPAY